MILRIALLAALLLTGCGKKTEERTDLVTFPLRGKVISVDTVGHTVTIAHEAIPNYMPAMVMPFKVKDRALLRGIQAGDSVGGTLAISRVESWLETLQPLSTGTPIQVLSPSEVVHVLHPGDILPDVAFLNQDGQSVRLSNLRGKAVAMTFIYTRCPLPDFCIRMSENFSRLQGLLRNDPAISDRWQLLSISFDPAFDRPGVLREYGLNYGARFGLWDFLTDPDTTGPAVARLADGIGLAYLPEQGLIEHNLRTVIVDPQGRLSSVINGNGWNVEEVAGKIRDLARR